MHAALLFSELCKPYGQIELLKQGAHVRKTKLCVEAVGSGGTVQLKWQFSLLPLPICHTQLSQPVAGPAAHCHDVLGSMA